RDQLIARAVSEAYRSMMPAGTYPAVILFIELPPADVDVNVHPAKTEVRFLHEGATIGIIRDAVIKAISASRTVARLPSPPAHSTRGRGDEKEPAWNRNRSGPGQAADQLYSSEQGREGRQQLSTDLTPLDPHASYAGGAAPDDFRLESSGEGRAP